MERDYQIVFFPESIIFQKDSEAFIEGKRMFSLVGPQKLLEEVDSLADTLRTTKQSLIDSFIGISLAANHLIDEQGPTLFPPYVMVGETMINLDRESLLGKYPNKPQGRKHLKLKEWQLKNIKAQSNNVTAFVNESLAFGVAICKAAQEEQTIGWPKMIPVYIAGEYYLFL